MSIKRYIISGLHPHVIESKDGFMVYYDDYARLMADFSQMTAWGRGLEHDKRLLEEVVYDLRISAEDDLQSIESARIENARLKSEIESLMTNPTSRLLRTEREENARLKAEVERLTKAVMHSPAAQLKLKELEGKTTYEEINPDNQ